MTILPRDGDFFIPGAPRQPRARLAVRAVLRQRAPEPLDHDRGIRGDVFESKTSRREIARVHARDVASRRRRFFDTRICGGGGGERRARALDARDDRVDVRATTVVGLSGSARGEIGALDVEARDLFVEKRHLVRDGVGSTALDSLRLALTLLHLRDAASRSLTRSPSRPIVAAPRRRRPRRALTTVARLRRR